MEKEDNGARSIEIRKNISENSVSFSILEGNKLAIAEASIMPIEIAKEFVEESKISRQEKDLIIQNLKECEKVFFFNRLNVPSAIGNKGYGTILLKELIKYVDENSVFLVNTANAYGEKSQKDLIRFYEKNGMRLISDDGGLVYFKNIMDLKGVKKPKI